MRNHFKICEIDDFGDGRIGLVVHSKMPFLSPTKHFYVKPQNSNFVTRIGVDDVWNPSRGEPYLMIVTDSISEHEVNVGDKLLVS